MAKANLSPGMAIDGFRLEQRLHRGGMADIWRVSRDDVDFPIVMKVPLLDFEGELSLIVGGSGYSADSLTRGVESFGEWFAPIERVSHLRQRIRVGFAVEQESRIGRQAERWLVQAEEAFVSLDARGRGRSSHFIILRNRAAESRAGLHENDEFAVAPVYCSDATSGAGLKEP